MNDEVHGQSKQSSENGWATKSTFVLSPDVQKTKVGRSIGQLTVVLKVSVSESRHIVVNHSLTHSLTWAMKHASQANHVGL